MRLIEAVAREKSVTRAAGGLNLSQSAVSHQLLNLERDLGTRLFDRVGKRMVPTAAGTRLLATAKAVLHDLAEAERAVRAAPGGVRVPLRAAASCHTLYAWLGRRIAQFGARTPGLDVQISFEGPRHETEALLSDAIDIAITSRPPAGGRFERRRLFALETVALVREDSFLVTSRTPARPAIRWADLAQETLFIHDLTEEDEARLRTAVGTGRSVNICRVQLTEAITELVRAGQGVGLLSRWPGQAPADVRGLTVMSIRPRDERTFWAVWRRANGRDLPFEGFARFLASPEKSSSAAAGDLLGAT